MNSSKSRSGGAACEARIERRLNRLGGVTATVDYATKTTLLTYSLDVTPDERS